MRKKFLKIASAALTAVLGLSLAACGGGGDDSKKPESVDSSKKQLYVYTYDGGYGHEWLNRVKTEYEKIHGDVQIVIDPKKPTSNNINKNFIKNGKNQVFFAEGQTYYSLLAENAIGDLTEAITSVNPYDNKKIIDKFTDAQKAYYNVSDKYYGLPHYAGYMGLIYNIDLFEANGWYIKDGFDTDISAKTEDMFVKNAGDAKSKGPDGKAKTSDDGLPATYEQFVALCDFIASTSEVAPLTWTGQYREQYVGYTYQSLVADYEGKDAFSLNFNFDGTANDLGRIIDGEFVKDETPTVINNDNGYELARQEGKYRALKFMDDLLGDERFYDRTLATNGNDENTSAMLRLIEGEAAMLMEGAWWENEADLGGYYKELGKTKNDFNMGWMPLPKASADKVGRTDTVIDHIFSLCFTRPDMNEEQRKLANDFIQFVNSDQMLLDFTKTTGTLKALNYDVSGANLDGLTTFAKSVIKFASEADVVYPFSNNSLFYNNQADFDGRQIFHSTYKDGSYEKDFKNPVYMLTDMRINEKRTTSVAAYFNGIYEYYKTNWSKFKG